MLCFPGHLIAYGQADQGNQCKPMSNENEWPHRKLIRQICFADLHLTSEGCGKWDFENNKMSV